MDQEDDHWTLLLTMALRVPLVAWSGMDVRRWGDVWMSGI
jgi:hypothetical protein